MAGLPGTLGLSGEWPLEEGVAAYSSILACRSPWTEELGGLQPISRTELNTTEAT